MTNSTLYNEKLVILNRLIKESTLTLEEAMLLLKEDSPYITTNTPGITVVTSNPFHNPFQGGHPYQANLSVALHGSANSTSVSNPEAVLSAGTDTARGVTIKKPELFTLT